MVNPISSKPVLKFLLFNSKQSPILCHFLHFSSFHSLPNPSYPSRRHEEESRNVKVSVWWDFENCSLPNGANVYKVVPSITSAIRANGIKGPIQITAFGDVMQLSRPNQEGLSSTGINLTHIPQGGKNSADRSLLVDLMYWVSQNPPPAHLFLISGDRDFASILHKLRMNNYNILLASPENAPGVLCSSASIMWQWSSLARGEGLTGKHFNLPPDGPYGSWYGHYRTSLANPFAVNEQSSYIKPEESLESEVDKVRPIPSKVQKHIRHILFSYPKGIPITELRAELLKNNVEIDNNFYGFRKFSRFLLAMPQILKLQSGTDGQFLVRGVPKLAEKIESISSVPKSTSDEIKIPKPNGEKTSYKESVIVDEKLSVPPSIRESKMINATEQKLVDELPKPYSEGTSEPKVAGFKKLQVKNSEEAKKGDLYESLKKLQEEPKVESHKKLQEEPKVESLGKSSEKKVEVEEIPKESIELPCLVQGVENDEEMKGQMMIKEDDRSVSEARFIQWIRKILFGNQDDILQGKKSVETDNISGENVENEKLSVTNNISVGENEKLSVTIAEADSVNTAEKSESAIDESKEAHSIWTQIMIWFKGLRSSDDSCEESSKEEEVIETKRQQQLYSEESFWNEMQLFLDTRQGSNLMSLSKTRMQIAHKLRSDGPCVLRSLSDDDLLQLVELLISDKKWVEECFFLKYPYKVTKAPEKDSKTELSSMFSSTKPQVKKEEQVIKEKKYERIKASDKSKEEMLCDCRKLVALIIKENPEGLQMGGFRRMFIENYGYNIDIQKLGYQKLSLLLQTMPGIRMENSYIVPSDKVKEDDESTWEELGPVDESVSKNKYELLSEDSDSDSDSENKTKSDKRLSSLLAKPDEELASKDSSLLQILDSWHGFKESKNSELLVKKEEDSESDKDDDVSLSKMLNNGKMMKKTTRKSIVFVEEDKRVNDLLSTFKKKSTTT